MLQANLKNKVSKLVRDFAIYFLKLFEKFKIFSILLWVGSFTNAFRLALNFVSKTSFILPISISVSLLNSVLVSFVKYSTISFSFLYKRRMYLYSIIDLTFFHFLLKRPCNTDRRTSESIQDKKEY